ncbi:MAG: hypothetical protein ACOCVF_04215 [bacterium]
MSNEYKTNLCALLEHLWLMENDRKVKEILYTTRLKIRRIERLNEYDEKVKLRKQNKDDS